MEENFHIEGIPLFYGDIDDGFIEKIAANIELGEDPENWDIEIIQHIHEKHPYLTGADTEVVFKKVSEKKGYGYGYVQINDMTIPIIIKEGEMSPLDVFLQGKKAYPLTEETVQNVLHTTDLGSLQRRPNAKEEVDSLIYNRTYPPYDGKYVFASENAKGEIVEVEKEIEQREYKSVLANVVKKDKDIAEWQSKVASDHNTTAKFYTRGMASVIQNVKSNTMAKFAHSLKNSPVKQITKTSAVIKEELGVEAIEVKKFGKYAVSKAVGEFHVGVVAPDVISFDGTSVGYGLFIGDEISSSMNKIAGCVMKGPAQLKPYTSPKPGEKLAFYDDSNPEETVVYEPVKMITKSATEGITQYKVMKGFNDIIKIAVSDKIKKVMKIDTDSYVIPATMKIAKLAPNFTVLTDPAHINRMAKYATGAGNLVIKFNSGEFSFHGPFVKEAKWRDGLAPQEAIAYMTEYYTKESTARFLKFAVKHGAATIQEPEYEEVIEKTASPKIHVESVDLTKEAAELDDQGLVDTVLSLKFINDDNVNQYVEYIPQFEKASSHLADLLIAARIGVDIKEAAVKKAMENMVKVTEQLKQLRGA